jgi:bifunctional DNA-binding transcriptional regulator/antitoxin component of YhaV-PrlF toxin-antitoxin module
LTAVVKADKKGRILLPIEIRRRFKSKRFEITAKGDVLELRPLDGIEELRGKYRGLIHSEWEDLEEKAEELVIHGER